MNSVLTCMVNDTLDHGNRSAELVSAVADYLGIAGGIALRERGRALTIALNMLDPISKSRVIMDPLVPALYDDVVVAAGLIPVYVDVSSEGVCIDPSKLERVVSTFQESDDSKTTERLAAIVTHTSLGYVPDMEAIAKLGVPIIEDISQGIGANTGIRRVGTYGRFIILSMEPDGIITTGGGTLLLATAKADASRLARLADELPTSALLSDMNAALGLTQAAELERFVARRSELAALFSRAVMKGRHTVPGQPGDAQNIYFTFPLTIAGGYSEVREYARKKGLETDLAFRDSYIARYSKANETRSQKKSSKVGEGRETPESGRSTVASGSEMSDDDFPSARALGLRCVRIPLYPALTGREISTIERVLSTLP